MRRRNLVQVSSRSNTPAFPLVTTPYSAYTKVGKRELWRVWACKLPYTRVRIARDWTHVKHKA